MYFDERADPTENRKQSEHRTWIGNGQEKRLRNIPNIILQACAGRIRIAFHAHARDRDEKPPTKRDQHQTTDGLNNRAMGLNGARDGTNAKPGAERNQSVAHDRANPGRQSAPETALDGALNAQDIDRANRRRNEHTYQQTDRNDKGVGNKIH